MSYQQRNSFAHMVSIGPRCQFHIFNGLTRNFGANSLTPKSFWPVTHKAVLFFGVFFFTSSSPPITDCWRGVIVHLCEFLSPFPWCKMPSLLQGCHFLECVSTTVSRAPLQPPWNNKPKLQSYPNQTMSFSSPPSLSFSSTFFGTYSQNSRTQLCTGTHIQTDNLGLSRSSLFAGNDRAC